MKKINTNPPKNIKIKKKIKSENSTPKSNQKKKKIIIGERKDSNVNEMRKLWESKKENKIENIHRKQNDTMSSLKVKNIISDLNLENSAKIVQSPKTSKSKPLMLQSRIDTWVKKDMKYGNRTKRFDD